jgi:hypothetical protein
MIDCNNEQFKSDRMAAWIQSEWLPSHPTAITLWTSVSVVNETVIERLDRAKSFDGFRFTEWERIDCPVVSSIKQLDDRSMIWRQTGAFVYHFTPEAGGAVEDVLVLCAHVHEVGWSFVVLGALAPPMKKAWTAFVDEANRLDEAYDQHDRVIVIGGRQNSFVPTVEWDEIVLPAALKSDLLNDVDAFFKKGVGIYQRLNLKPFRKLLLAGVPGTGKTMLCNALAKWALAQGYLVIYISSARKTSNEEEYTTSFSKIERALEAAASSSVPTLILLEELDAYLHEDEKALVLNVLDGSEAPLNPKGTLLVSTTNYPEAIDERVLKRPGRLDRVFIIPEVKTEVDAVEMLKRYLGAMWNDEFRVFAGELVGYPGAFIREVAIYALTQVAQDDLPDLPLPLLERSYKALKAQIDARDNFLKQRTFGLGDPLRSNGRGD